MCGGGTKANQKRAGPPYKLFFDIFMLQILYIFHMQMVFAPSNFWFHLEHVAIIFAYSNSFFLLFLFAKDVVSFSQE
jgi:hypothetical protein